MCTEEYGGFLGMYVHTCVRTENSRGENARLVAERPARCPILFVAASDLYMRVWMEKAVMLNLYVNIYACMYAMGCYVQCLFTMSICNRLFNIQ